MPDVERFSEPLKYLPIVYVLATISTLWLVYMVLHCGPNLQIGVRPQYVDHRARFWAQIELVVFNVITFLLLLCYAKSILTHPGEIPTGDPKWEYSSQPDAMPHLVKEKKKTGDRRHCKWCGKYKPDRCHHCRLCKACILKMDHHCPWIYNCVGFHNYKYFFLLLLYSVLACQWIFWTMLDTVIAAVSMNVPFAPMFLIFFGETLALFLSVLLTSFWSFHVWLMFMSMTTIEFCEKSMPKKDEEGGKRPEDRAWISGRRPEESAYNLGPYYNICAVLGRNPVAWFLPFSPPPGDGLTYETEESRLLPPTPPIYQPYGEHDQDPFLTKDMESRRSLKPKSQLSALQLPGPR